MLAQSLGAEVFLNCDLPSSAERLRDPESFFRSLGKGLVVLDEVHQLPDPSRIRKIAADAFPELRVPATGSSTLAATHKFRDSLTGRKRAVERVPVLAEETGSFGVPDLEARLLRGGLPPALLGSDAGFVSCARGWDSLRPEDRGMLWEHLVLDTLVSLPLANLSYWRDKQRPEIDFVLPTGRGAVDAIECKWNVDAFETRNLPAFRARCTSTHQLFGFPRTQKLAV